MGCPQSKSKGRTTETSKMKIGNQERKQNITVSILTFRYESYDYTVIYNVIFNVNSPYFLRHIFDQFVSSKHEVFQ